MDLDESSEGSPRTKCVAYVVSNELAKTSSLLPSNINRSLLVHSLVKAFGLFSPKPGSRTQLRPLRPIPATMSDLAVYHTRDYLDFVLDGKNAVKAAPGTPSRAEFGLEDDCPPFHGLPDYIRLVAGASLTAANALKDGNTDIAICWDGGRHHAQKSHASGFCYVADCVLSIMSLRRSRVSLPDGTFRKPRILYLDLDLHFSDAVSQSFVSSTNASAPSQILTLSIHHTAPGFFPTSPLAALSDPDDPSFDPFTLSLPLARGTSSASFAKIWASVELIKNTFKPDFTVVQCGVDGLAGDPYATWNLSLADGEGSLGWCIDRICSEWACKVLLLGGGGYNSPNAARAWTYMTSVALGCPLSPETDIPDHAAFPFYAPSFTLDVPAGNVQDQNTQNYLDEVQARLARIACIIAERMESI
ncbi:histone deacetylase 8 [Cristinia sonorae]|uniref:Histone deacetylase 8 n=1 Tax=Cristinia sonorae TaxID=1940300 RepID=A0A8K0XQ84_9AGAR|nr:histone deacetylase 8 [Cristinia sonorae]